MSKEIIRKYKPFLDEVDLTYTQYIAMMVLLTLVLCGGDAFHLIPRVKKALKGSDEKVKKQLGLGLQISSITMTVFYIILLYIWKFTFSEIQAPVFLEMCLYLDDCHGITVTVLVQ